MGNVLRGVLELGFAFIGFVSVMFFFSPPRELHRVLSRLGAFGVFAAAGLALTFLNQFD